MKFKRTVFRLLVALVVSLSPTIAEARSPYAPNSPAPTAQTCPRDTIVWVNTKSGIYHMPGMRWYGRTAQGEYMCRQAADQSGYRPTHNGQ